MGMVRGARKVIAFRRSAGFLADPVRKSAQNRTTCGAKRRASELESSQKVGRIIPRWKNLPIIAARPFHGRKQGGSVEAGMLRILPNQKDADGRVHQFAVTPGITVQQYVHTQHGTTALLLPRRKSIRSQNNQFSEGPPEDMVSSTCTASRHSLSYLRILRQSHRPWIKRRNQVRDGLFSARPRLVSQNPRHPQAEHRGGS